MMATLHIETADDLVRVIGELWERKSLRALKQLLADIPNEEEFYRLIRLSDEADLYGCSNLLATTSYKRFGTLSSYAWHCARLSETGRSLEAEEKMLARLQGIHAHSYTNEELQHAHHLLLKVYCQLNRIPEAAEQLARIKELGGTRPDQEAFFHIYSGNWDGAEAVLKSELEKNDRKWSPVIHLLYADLLSMRGAPERALELLEVGRAKFQDVHAFDTERVARLHQLGRYRECLADMDKVLARNPYHARRRHFIHLAAHCLYELGRFEELEAWIEAHPGELKDSLYTKAKIDPHGKHQKLALTPEVQKLNYCVPASLSLMLQAFGKHETQDSIAEHVFDVTGSKLRTTMKYMETQGFEARYFKGTVELYKQFIDAGVPVLLSMLIENSAHVQVVVGYDDRLQALAIQDPNDLGPFLVAYDEVPNMFRLSDSLSMVFVDTARQEMLTQLNDDDHQFFSELYDLLDKEPLQEQQFTQFLTQHQHERYAAVVGLTLALNGSDELYENWLKRLTDELGTDDAELALLAAHLYYQKEQGDKALEALQSVPQTRSPYALFLQAAISMSQGHSERAIPLLKRSIELDHYQPLAYSHLARCYLESGRIFQAYKWSTIAIQQLEEDIFAQITHGLIQYEYGAYEQAYRRFKGLAGQYPDDGYFLYEMGRCEQALEKKEDALKTYRRSLALDPALPFPYLRMAELFMEDERWEEAQAAIEEGLAQDDQQDILHLYLGHIAIEQERFPQAETSYRRALELDPEDLFAPVHIAHALFGQQRNDEALALLNECLPKADAAFRLRAADIIWDQVTDASGKAQALQLIEDGFVDASTEDLHLLAQRYAEFGEEPTVRHRVIKGVKRLRHLDDPLLLCLEADLHELAGNGRFAKQLYERAGNFPQALVKRGLLQESIEDYPHAIRLYEQATEQEAGNAPALGGLVRCYRELDVHGKAFTAALDYLSAEPLSTVLPELVDFVDTESDIQKLELTIDRIEDQVPAEWLYAARAHVQEAAGNFQEAEQWFLRANEEPSAFPSRFQYVQFLNRVGQTKRALELLEQLISEVPDEAELYSEYVATLEALSKMPRIHKRLSKVLSGEALGKAYVHAAEALIVRVETLDADEAHGFFSKLRLQSKKVLFPKAVITLCESAVKLLPDSEEPVLTLAQFYLAGGMAHEAASELKPYAGIPGNAKRLFIFANLQHAHETTKPKEYQAVLAQLEAYGEVMDAEMLTWWSEALAATDEPKQAIVKLDEAIALEPFTPDLYTRKWDLLSHTDEQALPAFEQSLPEELLVAEWLLLTRASTYSTQGQGQRAKELVEPLLLEMPQFVPARYELARAEMAQNNSLVAKGILQQLLAEEESTAIWEMAREDSLFDDIFVELSRAK